MRRTTLRNGVFAAVTAAALGFGATQALAAPQEKQGARLCSNENHAYCNQLCWNKGADGGYCTYQGCKCVYN